jgi:ABC-2 type transport system permease protein
MSGHLAGARWHRIQALTIKEFHQIRRDRSVFLIAIVLPMLLLFLFAYAVSLDLKRVPIAVVLESDSAQAVSLASAFSGSRYFTVHPARDRRQASESLLEGRIRGFVVIPQNFDALLHSGQSTPIIQVVNDGTQPNTANFVGAYTQGVFTNWIQRESISNFQGGDLVPRFRFNPEVESRRFLIPGAIAVVMTIIGTLLTALVIAREWERGTMEALFSTPVSATELILGKLIPYFLLGITATVVATLLAIYVFDVPLRGSWLALMLSACCFLIPALGQGLLISTTAKNQFIASQIALFSGFLPAFLLSGFLYQISTMPLPLRIITHLIPARYFVDSLQTVFLAGDLWHVFLPNMAAMLGIGLFFLTLVHRKTKKTLDVSQ